MTHLDTEYHSDIESPHKTSSRTGVFSCRKIADADNPPLRAFFGTSPLQLVPQVYAGRLKTWEEWADVATEAQGSAA